MTARAASLRMSTRFCEWAGLACLIAGFKGDLSGRLFSSLQTLISSSCFDLDIHARCDRENFQLVDGVWGGVEEVENADVCAHLELLARLAVDVRRSEYGEDLALGGKRDRSHNAGTGPFRRFNNVLYGTVEHPLIKCFEADPYSFSGLFCHSPTS